MFPSYSLGPKFQKKIVGDDVSLGHLGSGDFLIFKIPSEHSEVRDLLKVQ